MANVRIKDLARVTAYTAGDAVAVDGATSRSITVEDLFESAGDAALISMGEYETFAAAKAATIPASLNFLRTRSYTADVPESGARYRKVVGDPGFDEPGAFQSSDNAWWQLNEIMPTPRMFGCKGDGTNDKTAMQLAIDLCAEMEISHLWFDVVYTIGGSKHANGLSILDWKQVSLIGPGGLRLADNTNVANAVFTATVSGTTMTVSAVASGSLPTNQFLSGTGLPVAVQIAEQLGGTPLGVGTYRLTESASIGSPITVYGVNRLTEMLGNYDLVTGLSNIECGIEFDYNGVNNCASGTIWSWNAVLSVNKGSNVKFDGAKFLNNCGSNDMVLGTLTAGTPTISNVTITNCLFENQGDRINAASKDYSSIFCIADGLSITVSTWRNGPTLNGAPWEVYGRNIVVNGNKVSGYYNTANICAIENMTTSNVVFSSNVIKDCSVGFTLWATHTTSKLWGISIIANVLSFSVSSPGGPYFVNGTSQVVDASDLREIVIHGNTATNRDLADVARTSAGIYLHSFYTAKITENSLWGFPGHGMHLTYPRVGCTLDVSRNALINCGYGTTNKTGMTFAASTEGNAANLTVEGNTVNPISGYTMTAGIVGALDADSGFVGRNSVVGATTKVSWTGTGVDGVFFTTVEGTIVRSQGAPTAKTTSSTLTGANLLTGIITVNQGAGATSAQQLPTAADMDTAVATRHLATDHAIEFVVINTSTVDAEDASVTTNTGWTLVGNMDIPAYSAAGSLNSSARFLARKTGTAAWTLYRA